MAGVWEKGEEVALYGEDSRLGEESLSEQVRTGLKWSHRDSPCEHTNKQTDTIETFTFP